METLICHGWGAFKESEFSGFLFNLDGDLYCCAKDNEPQPIYPYDEDELWQSVRDGKLNPCELGRFNSLGLSAADSDVPKQNADLPALLFLVRDSKGNVKLCNAKRFVRSSLDGSVSDAARASFDEGVNLAAFIGNPFLCRGDSLKNISQNL